VTSNAEPTAITRGGEFVTHIVGTLILAPCSRIAACDAGAARLFRCAPSALLGKAIASFLPDLPLKEHFPSENVRYASQFGSVVLWQPQRALASGGGELDVELILSRCGYRPGAALWLTLRRPQERRARPAQHAGAQPSVPQPAFGRDTTLAA
jgi:hypothetical protein